MPFAERIRPNDVPLHHVRGILIWSLSINDARSGPNFSVPLVYNQALCGYQKAKSIVIWLTIRTLNITNIKRFSGWAGEDNRRVCCRIRVCLLLNESGQMMCHYITSEGY